LCKNWTAILAQVFPLGSTQVFLGQHDYRESEVERIGERKNTFEREREKERERAVDR